MVLTANAVTGRGWVDPLFGEYSSKKEEMINGVRVKRLKTRWQITSTMYILKNRCNCEARHNTAVSGRSNLVWNIQIEPASIAPA